MLKPIDDRFDEGDKRDVEVIAGHLTAQESLQPFNQVQMRAVSRPVNQLEPRAMVEGKSLYGRRGVGGGVVQDNKPEGIGLGVD